MQRARPRPPARPTGAAPRPRPSPARLAGRGVVGGLVATGIMTLYRYPIFRGLPPTAELWATRVQRGDPERFVVQGLLLHALYGALAGGLFGLGFGRLDLERDPSRRRLGLACGLGYGLLLSVVGTRYVFPHLLEEGLDPDEALAFHVGHVMYGLTLGTWLGFREALGEVYD